MVDEVYSFLRQIIKEKQGQPDCKVPRDTTRYYSDIAQKYLQKSRQQQT